MPTDLTVTRLSTTPVKGLALHHPDSVELTPEGPVGDRLFFLVDDDGKIQSCTGNQGLYGLVATYDAASRRLTVSRGGQVLVDGAAEPGQPVDTDMWGTRLQPGHVVADPAFADFFSDAVGRRVRLVRADGSAFDVHPATLLGTASVDRLARHARLPAVDGRRFRMLVEFSGGEPHVEDTWVGHRLEVGGAVLVGGGPVKRCAATTREPDTGEVDLQTLRMIMDYRGRQESDLGAGAMFGTYATVLEPGTVSVGDVLRVHAG